MKGRAFIAADGVEVLLPNCAPDQQGNADPWRLNST